MGHGPAAARCVGGSLEGDRVLMSAGTQPVELAATMGVGTDGPDVDIERLVKRELARMGLRAVEASGEHLASVAPGNRLALASMLVSLATMATLIAFVVTHEMGNSKFEEAIYGLIDVLEQQNPGASKDLRNVERKMR